VYEVTLKDVKQPGLPPPVSKTNSVSSTKTGPNVQGVKTFVVLDDKKLTTYFPSNELNGLQASPGVLTNFVIGESLGGTAQPVPKTPALPLDDGDEETPPLVDATLEETERILVDYVTLLSNKGIASQTR
jgi:hypothetical protein